MKFGASGASIYLDALGTALAMRPICSLNVACCAYCWCIRLAMANSVGHLARYHITHISMQKYRVENGIMKTNVLNISSPNVRVSTVSRSCSGTCDTRPCNTPDSLTSLHCSSSGISALVSGTSEGLSKVSCFLVFLPIWKEQRSRQTCNLRTGSRNGKTTIDGPSKIPSVYISKRV